MLDEHSGVAAGCHQVCRGAVRSAIPQPEESNSCLWLLLGFEIVWKVAEIQGPHEVDDLLGQLGSTTRSCPSEFLPGVNYTINSTKIILL